MVMKCAFLPWRKDRGPTRWELHGFNVHGNKTLLAFTQREMSSWLIILSITDPTLNCKFSTVEEAKEYGIDYHLRMGWTQISEQAANLL